MTDREPVTTNVTRSRRGERWFAAAFSVLLVAAVVWPVTNNWRRGARDDFPLSHYPMFSMVRDESVDVIHVVGVDRQLQPHVLRHSDVAPGGMNQVRRQLRRVVKSGRAFELCNDVAKNVAASTSPRHRDLVNVAVVHSRFHLEDFMAGNRLPVDVHVIAGCPVERSPR